HQARCPSSSLASVQRARLRMHRVRTRAPGSGSPRCHRHARDPLGDRQLLDCRLLAVAAADLLALRLLHLELEGRQLIPGEQGSGTLFLNENSSSAAFKPTMLAAATAEPMNPRRESSDMVSPCRRVIRK